jgi:hypothetical protein
MKRRVIRKRNPKGIKAKIRLSQKGGTLMRTVKYKGMAKSGWNLLIMSTIFHPVLFFWSCVFSITTSLNTVS